MLGKRCFCLVPLNWIGEIVGRSSHECKRFHTLPTIVDYRRNGQRMHVFATYSGEGEYVIRKGERIAQLVLSRAPAVCVEVVDAYGDRSSCQRQTATVPEGRWLNSCRPVHQSTFVGQVHIHSS